MSLLHLSLDAPTVKLALCTGGGLLLLMLVRIMFLLRTHSRLETHAAKMEKQVLAQHGEIIAVRRDSNAWRGECLRLLDAFRAEFYQRMTDAEKRGSDIRSRHEALSIQLAEQNTLPPVEAPPAPEDLVPTFPALHAA